MSGKLSNLSRRVAEVEQQVDDRAGREELTNCICREWTFTHDADAFEEMNRTCPVHGFRRLGRILPVSFVRPDRTLTEESTKLLQLVETYKLRLSQRPQSGAELKDDSQEP